jgi:hypothetical protein
LPTWPRPRRYPHRTTQPREWRAGLQGLAIENKRLLERAIAAQGRVIGVIARAAAPATVQGYGSERGRRPAAFALVAKA